MSEPEEFKPYKTDMFGDHFRHPTFGTVSFSRGHGGNYALFGSSIRHNETITMVISHAEFNRDLQRDWINSRDAIVEVIMSPTQFADAITGLNVGTGVPVTIRFISPSPGENLYKTETPYQNKVEQFNDEFEQTVAKLAQRFDDILKLAEDAKAQKRLVKEIELLKSHIVNNLPFINRSFSEQMEQTVKEAKGEVEAFVEHTIQNYGIDAIRHQAPQIPEAAPKQITGGNESHGS